MIKKLLLPLVATVAFAAPATAAITTTTQLRSFSLATLDDAAIAGRVSNWSSFDSFGLTGQRLISVKLDATYFINGIVVGTNNATGGNNASRLRNFSASYTLNAATTGPGGLSLSGSNLMSQTVSNVGGNGTTRNLNLLNPIFSASQTTTDVSAFLAGPVITSSDASAVFASVAAANVSYGVPQITGGRADFIMSYNSIVPEAPTWAMLISGFGLVGFAARRRNAAVAA